MTELVKNAHDADASTVTMSFRVAAAEGEIVVHDDGCGMSLETVLGVWMEPGATSKGELDRRLTLRGRRVLGAKGVGRFAADKLARRLELITRQADGATEVRAVFDWDRFDSDSSMLADVRNRWEVIPASTIATHGTVLRMTGLRSAWTERMFRRLCTRLARLRPPLRGSDDFAIRVESDEFPEYSGEVRVDFLDRAPYRIEAVFDGESSIQVALKGGRSDGHAWNGGEPLRCGPARVRIFAFDLETDAIARIGPRMDVRTWLREWSGISVYRDGFRIWPYGEPHDDWLRLDQRRVNNPVVRLSNNQVVGFVEISAEANPGLQDQTNREGLIHGREFDDLRRLLHLVLQLLEAERQTIRHPAGGNGNGNGARGGTPRTLEPVLLRRSLEGYAEMAAAGQSATLLALTIRPLVEDMRRHLAGLRDLMAPLSGASKTRVLRELEALAGAIDQQAMMVAFTHPDVRSSRRTIDVVAELERCRETLRPLLDLVGVRMDVGVRRGQLLRVEMRPETFHHLVCILVKNALEWAPKVRAPRVRIVARTRGDHCELFFADNGPGIPRTVAARVFEPMYSGREGGRGMGLTVARTLVELHRGEIEIMPGRKRGAVIRVLLARKRARATVDPS